MENENSNEPEKKSNNTLVIILGAALVIALIAIVALVVVVLFGDSSDSGGEAVATLPPPVITVTTPEGELVPTRVPPTLVLPTPAPSEPMGRVIAPDGVNIRTGPGTEYDVIGLAPYGATSQLDGISADGTWYAAKVLGAPNNLGWAVAEFIEALNVEDLPVIAAPPTPTPPATATPTATPAPDVTFTASRTQINAGETVLLSWSVENVKAVYMFPVGANFADYPVTGQGSQEVQPFITTTYVLLVFNRDDSTSSQSIEIRVNGGLTSNRWIMKAYQDSSGALVSNIPGTEVTARFNSDGSLTGFGGCNSYSGSFTAYDQILLVGSLTASQSFCENPAGIMDQEAAFLNDLRAASTFSISGSELNVFNASGKTVLSFVRG